ncbi:MAG: hypothetical protein PVH96_09515, partial [Gemmatimonadota bacterium]
EVHDCAGITTAAELDWCMARARVAINALQGATGKVLQDAGTAFGAASLAPPAKAAASAVGSVIYAADLYFDAASHLLPSELSELKIELTRSSFKEDEDSTGTWHNSEISAKSAGWSLDQRIVNTLLDKGGVSNAFGDVAVAAANLTGTGLGEVLGFLVSDRITNAITAKTGDPNGIIQIPSQTFGPVNVDAEEWTDSHVDASGVLAMTTRTVYEPRKTGTGEVVVETREGRFGGQQREAREPVHVGLITIGIDPTTAKVDPGATRSFDVTVHNADHPERLQVTAEHGSVTSVAYQGAGLHKVSYKAPSETSFHDVLTAVDTASTGTLQYSGRQPLAQADITSDVELMVDPLAACIDEVGQDTTFTATVVGLENKAVTWTVKQGPGTVDDNGTYTATEVGSAVLEVTAVADTTLKAQVQVTVGGCSCWWAVDITGVPPFGSGFMDDAWTLTYGESAGQLTNITLGGDATTGASATFSVGPLAAGGISLSPGFYDVTGVGSYVSQSTITHQFLSTDSVPPLTLSLLEADSAHVQGDISGNILVDTQPIGDGNYSIANVQATFRITPNAVQDTGYGPTLNVCEWPW